MAEVVVFKSGKDLGEAAQPSDEDSVTCESCGATESDENAFLRGWQLEPAVCPDCLRWTAADETCCGGGKAS